MCPFIARSWNSKQSILRDSSIWPGIELSEHRLCSFLLVLNSYPEKPTHRRACLAFVAAGYQTDHIECAIKDGVKDIMRWLVVAGHIERIQVAQAPLHILAAPIGGRLDRLHQARLTSLTNVFVFTLLTPRCGLRGVHVTGSSHLSMYPHA